jgi:hypothetical protein
MTVRTISLIISVKSIICNLHTNSVLLQNPDNSFVTFLVSVIVLVLEFADFGMVGINWNTFFVWND